MKTKIRKTVTVIAITAISAVTLNFTAKKQQTDNSLARVKKTNNKLFFFRNEPVNDYEISFTFVNQIENMNCKNPQEIINESIKNANIEAANQSRFYDAIIFGTGERDMAITWKDKTKDNAIARANKVEGVLFFVECEPLTKYDIASKFDVSGVGQQLLLGTCPTFDEKITKLMRKATKSKVPYDALLYGSSTNDMSIKFK